ncbi:hypothetical protein [Aromatoleum diolicum]|uniref:Uncharacterized protein n=1 Tax=Aromatoleum diolicum TaxID=75796 RepID=A0ABX1Q6J0_9RHOO|nr:hypothetical protein [Aromatoleum diolicum]NMG73988.1 hypothetical protein [Aromatoleum diolicum]
MTSYKHFILPAVLVGNSAVASVFATFMADRLRHTRKGRQKAALADWEDEGGSVVVPEATTPSS